MRAAGRRTVLRTASVLAVPLVLTGPARATGQRDAAGPGLRRLRPLCRYRRLRGRGRRPAGHRPPGCRRPPPGAHPGLLRTGDLTAAGDPRTCADLSTAEALAGIGGYADGVGPDKGQVVPREADGALGEPTSFVADAHGAGLVVHPYTFRNENEFLPADLRDAGEEPGDYGRAIEERLAFWAAGIDGMFTGDPDTGVLTRDLFEG